MTIGEQTDFILNHPHFKVALENHRNGYADDLRYILIIHAKEAANKTKAGLIRYYGTDCKHLNIADIKDSFQKWEIPSTMDVRLPVVKPAEVTLVKRAMAKMKLVIQNQYDLFEQVA